MDMNAITSPVCKADIACVTGHRPKTMGWGYDLTSEKWVRLQDVLKGILRASGCKTAWTGMALGVDTVFARAVLDLKAEGVPIRLCCAVPFRGQESKWREENVHEYRSILARADETVIVNQGGYAGWKMTDRDRFMVDRSRLVIAVWNGSGSGTGRCAAYASGSGKRVLRVDPALI